MQIAVLGAGMVGSVMAADLIKSGFEVTLSDASPEALERAGTRFGLKGELLDVQNHEALARFVTPFDLIISAVPGHLGFSTTKQLLRCSKNVVDIAFFPEDPFELDQIAKDMNVFAITDCGVSPGMSNLLLGHMDEELQGLKALAIYVGGLTRERVLPYEYRAVFSPIDVIEEYIRPARMKVNGQLVTRPALSEPELLNFDGVGTLEAFNTDGLRSILKTLNAPDMKEKTLRYPGHAARMAELREAGFFSNQPLAIRGQHISPLEFTSKILCNSWRMREGDRDFTILRVICSGTPAGRTEYRGFELFDEFDESTGFSSMSRSTGFTATSMVRAFAEGLIKQSGLLLPETLGRDSRLLAFLLEDLQSRNLYYRPIQPKVCKSLLT